MKEQELRDRFEADVKDLDINLSKSNGAYVSSETNLIWFGYKAASSPLLERIAELTQQAGDMEKLANEMMLERDALALDAERWRAFTGDNLCHMHEPLYEAGSGVEAQDVRWTLWWTGPKATLFQDAIGTALQHKEQT